MQTLRYKLHVDLGITKSFIKKLIVAGTINKLLAFYVSVIFIIVIT
jgi:hypothetical protein